MKKKYDYDTIADFAGKMDWEGGIWEFASYGCSASKIQDKKLSKLWEKFMQHFKKADKIAEEIEEYIDKNTSIEILGLQEQDE